MWTGVMYSVRTPSLLCAALAMAWCSKGVLALASLFVASPAASTPARNLVVPPTTPEADPEVFRVLATEFELQYGEKVRSIVAALDGPAIMTLSGGQERLLSNFLLHAEFVANQTGSSMNVVNAVHDQASFDACQDVRERLSRQEAFLKVFCLDLVGWMPASRLVDNRITHAGYWWTKPIPFVAAVQASCCGILFMDVDVILHDDLLDYVQKSWNERLNPQLTTGSEWWKCCNSGTVFAKQASLDLLNQWVEEDHLWVGRGLGDQSALVEVLQRGGYLDGRDGDERLEVLPHAVVGQLCHKGSHAVHYNCPSKLDEHGKGKKDLWLERGNVTLKNAGEMFQGRGTRSALMAEQLMKEGGDWWLDEGQHKF